MQKKFLLSYKFLWISLLIRYKNSVFKLWIKAFITIHKNNLTTYQQPDHNYNNILFFS